MPGALKQSPEVRVGFTTTVGFSRFFRLHPYTVRGLGAYGLLTDSLRHLGNSSTRPWLAVKP